MSKGKTNELLIAEFVLEQASKVFERVNAKFITDLNTVLDSFRAEASRLSNQIALDTKAFAESLNRDQTPSKADPTGLVQVG